MAQANHFAPEMWSVLAGFCEVGESLEQTVHREVLKKLVSKLKMFSIGVHNIGHFPIR